MSWPSLESTARGRPDALRDARDVVAEAYPQARWAILGGSVLTPSSTAGSDLDIVVLLPDNDPAAPCRDSRRFRSWPVELFVYDEQSLAHYLAKERAERRPVLARMIANGTQVAGDRADAAGVRDECTKVLAAGPAPLNDAERERIRYRLTDLLDDLTHAVDPGERMVIAAAAWFAAAEDVIAVSGHWRGTSKWLLRELRDLDPEIAERWLAAYADPDAVAAFVREALDRAGGPLFAGYRVRGERPGG